MPHNSALCTSHSLNKPSFASQLVSTIWWLHWGWVRSAPGSDKSLSVHMNKHWSERHKPFPWARHWARMFSVLSAAGVGERPQAFIANKLNIHVSLAPKGCLASFYFIFNSEGLNKHSVAAGVQRHPTKPNATKSPQNMVPIAFIPIGLVAG